MLELKWNSFLDNRTELLHLRFLLEIIPHCE